VMVRSIARIIQTICFWSSIFQMIIGAAGCADNPSWAVERFITSVVLIAVWAIIGYVISVHDDRENSKIDSRIVRRAYKNYQKRDDRIPEFMR